jgi:hypothetical protein
MSLYRQRQRTGPSMFGKRGTHAVAVLTWSTATSIWSSYDEMKAYLPPPESEAIDADN